MKTENLKILFIDDEENILHSMKRIFHKSEYKVLITTEPVKAFELLKSEKIAVIISDQRMPKMEGVEVLRNARSISPDTIRIMLTGYADLKAAMRAVNDGNVYRFLAKPWNDDEIRGAISAAVQQYCLVEDHRHLLNLTKKQNEELTAFNEDLEKKIDERTAEVSKLNTELKAAFFTTIKLMGAMGGIFNPKIEGHTFRVAKIAGFIAKESGLSEKEIFDVQVAAFLHNIGGINNIVATIKGLGLNEVKLGAKIISLIPNLGKAPLYTFHQFERFDGAGFPDKLAGEKIPFGSRIISVAAAYDRLLHFSDFKKANPNNVLEEIKKEASAKFDPEVIRLLYKYVEQFLKDSEAEFEQTLSLHALQPGMIVSRAIKTIKGEILVAKDYELSDEIIEGLWQRQITEQVLEDIFVYKNSFKKIAA